MSCPPEVVAAFDALPEDARPHLNELRALILKTAAETEGVGPVLETLKWGQPAYLTQQSGSGTTIRLGAARPGLVAIYVHCQTSIIGDFADHFADVGQVEGQRAVHIPTDAPLPVAPLRLLIRHALTYHLNRTSG
ncbi:MAG: DUF1801 domain-containing protein [Pseudomonadota bacterium]